MRKDQGKVSVKYKHKHIHYIDLAKYILDSKHVYIYIKKKYRRKTYETQNIHISKKKYVT